MPEALRVGRISYTNVAPIETAFDAGAVLRDAIVTSAAPTVLNAMLSGGELDVSPVSAAHYLRNTATLEIFGDCAIAARGSVISVLLVSARPPSLLDRASIAATADSASGRVLLEALLRGRYAVRATFERVDDATAEAVRGRPTLLIGDAAVAIYDRVPANWIYDLGSAWLDWTALPMVYAVWAVRRDVLHRSGELDQLAQAYAHARTWGRQHRDAVIDAAMLARPRSHDFYARYYTTLQYELDAPLRAGLMRFGSEIAHLEAAHVTR